MEVVVKKREDSMDEDAELRKHFEPSEIVDDPDIRKLDVEREKLNDAWTQFLRILPPDARVESVRRPADFEDVVAVMEKIEGEWQQKREKGAWGITKKYLRRVGSTINSHSTLLKILPSDSQYASIFCGTLQTLLKASANYEKIAAGLSRALLEITEAVAVCAKECALYATKALIGGIATLYAHIFCFLRNAIEWYTKRSSSRLLSSFKEDFYEKFEDQVANIKQISASINREAQHASHSEIRFMRTNFAKVGQNLSIGLQGLQREAAERREREERFAKEKAKEEEYIRMLFADQPRLLHLVALGAKTLLQGQASAFLLGGHTQIRGETEASQGRQTAEDIPTSLISDNKMLGKDELLLFSSELEDHIDRDRVMIEHDGSSVTYIDWQVVSALEEWTTSGSQILCIVGPNQVVDTPPTTMVATNYVVSANKAKIPVISYFCELPRRGTKIQRSMTTEMSGLISLTYAFIRQLIELLPSFVTDTERLGEQRFTKLEGSMNSYDEAITVLGELLDLSPPMLFCVIDAIEVLDDKSTANHMKALINTLRGHKTYRSPLTEGSDRVLKILFTTAGRSRTLLTDLRDDELVFAERSGSARNPGRPSAGRRSLSPTPLKSLKDDRTP